MKKWFYLLIGTIIILSFFSGYRIGHLTSRSLPFGSFEKLPHNEAISELFFPNDGICDEVSNYWKSNGICYNGEIDGEKGVIIFHPLTVDDPAFLYKSIELPSNVTTLYLRVANLANKLENFGIEKGVGDNVFKILIFEPDKKTFCLRDNFIVTSEDGWIEKVYNISNCDRKIVFYIFNYAGGNLMWSGEWGGIGKIKFE
ncbi:MAG: hypothetical protein QXT38_01365 [Candidatus Aenigmatarchaeota archaeon]